MDNPYRDLPGLVLVAMNLCQQGATCYLVPFNLREPELGALAPDFVLLNYLHINNQQLARHLIEAGIQVGVLDTEGGVLPDFDYYGQVLADDEWVRSRISCFCSWGQRLADHAVKMAWFDTTQVVVTGSPRMDFYAHPWRKAALQATANLDRYATNLVLVNGNFSLANPAFSTPEQEIEGYVNEYGFDEEKERLRQETERQAMEELAGLAGVLAARFPEACVVYRPHPFERLETYHALLDKRPNLHLVKESAVSSWILRARVVIQSNCSTAIEAGLADVPAVSPAWMRAGTELPAADAVSIRCGSQGELLRNVEKILEGKFEHPDYVERQLDLVTGDWFNRRDGRAHQRVAEAITERLGSTKTNISKGRCLDLAYGLKRGPLSRRYKVGARARRYLGRPIVGAFSAWPAINVDGWKSSEKYFSEAHVRRLTDAIHVCSQSDHGNQFGPVSVGMASHNGDYIAPYEGLSVTMSAA